MPKIIRRLKVQRAFRHEWRRKSERLAECANCKLERRTIQKDGKPSVSYGKKGAVAATKVAPRCDAADGRARLGKILEAPSRRDPKAESVGGLVVVVNTIKPLLYAADDVQRVLALDEAGLAAAVASGKLKRPLAGGRWCSEDLERYVRELQLDRGEEVEAERRNRESSVSATPPIPDTVYGGAAARDAGGSAA